MERGNNFSWVLCDGDYREKKKRYFILENNIINSVKSGEILVFVGIVSLV